MFPENSTIDPIEKIISLSFRSIYPLSSIAIRFNFALNAFISSSSSFLHRYVYKKLHRTGKTQISVLQSRYYKYYYNSWKLDLFTSYPVHKSIASHNNLQNRFFADVKLNSLKFVATLPPQYNI